MFLNNIKSVAIFGASGAIGEAFMAQLAEYENIQHIYTFSRKKMAVPPQKIKHSFFDFNDPTTIASAVQIIPKETPIELCLVTSGILHTDTIQPEKSIKQVDLESLQTIFNANTFGPMLIAKHIAPYLKKGSPNVFAALSARVGSIQDNRLGGWYTYRASKTALNMFIKTWSIESSRHCAHRTILGLHPGTVHSALSEPFHKHIKQDTIISPNQSAEALLHVINQRYTPEHTGNVFDWKNTPILS